MCINNDTCYVCRNGRMMSRDRYLVELRRLDMSSGLTDEVLDKLFEEHGFATEVAIA